VEVSYICVCSPTPSRSELQQRQYSQIDRYSERSRAVSVAFTPHLIAHALPVAVASSLCIPLRPLAGHPFQVRRMPPAPHTLINMVVQQTGARRVRCRGRRLDPASSHVRGTSVKRRWHLRRGCSVEVVCCRHPACDGTTTEPTSLVYHLAAEKFHRGNYRAMASCTVLAGIDNSSWVIGGLFRKPHWF